MPNRRKFLKGLSLSSVAATLRLPMLSGPAGFEWYGSAPGRPEHGKRHSAQLANGIALDLLMAGDEYIGIGKVTAGKVVLRSGEVPLTCDLRTPDGHQVTRLLIAHHKITPDEIELSCTVTRKTNPVMEYMLHSVRNRENLYGWLEKPKPDPDTKVVIRILPVTRKTGNHEWQGFSYQYKYHGPGFPLFKILDKGTWEIGGGITGNEVWMRVGHVPSIVPFTGIEQRYSTENYMYGIANPNIFQFLPLQTELQGFTFQCHPEGILVTWPTQVAHVRTLLEKPAGSNQCYHFHQHCQDLAEDLQTSPMEVLWLPQVNTDRTARYNIYEEMRRIIHSTLHRQAGIRTEYISTYGIIEQWDEPDLDKYADEILPRLVELGIKRIFLPNEFENVMNVWGLSNMCCNVDFKFTPEMEPKVRRFCAAAKAAGITVDMWGNTALSTTTEMFQWRDGREKGIRFLPRQGSVMEALQRATDPFVRNPSNAIEADHYTPRFAVLNLRDPEIMDYWLTCWRQAFDTGIGGIFLDSSFNMTSDKFHFIQNASNSIPYPPANNPANPDRFFRPAKPFPSAILSQYGAHLEMVKRMQDIGYSYCGEDLGVFGIHRHGPDADMIADCIPLYSEAVMDFNEDLLRKKGYDPFRVYFQGLAHRVMWAVHWDFKSNAPDSGISDSRAMPLLKVFNRVNAEMRNREISHGGDLVTYRPGNETAPAEVHWALAELTIPLEATRGIEDLITGRRWAASRIDTESYHIYRIT